MSAAIERHEYQDSPEWHEYRAYRGNASELAALMGCAPWFPRTPYELWLVKTGRASIERNAPMERGRALEPVARKHLESVWDEVFEPQVVARERISASLDGKTFDGRLLLEIKCPMRGRDSECWAHVAEHGRPPEHYWWQVQQQLYCAGAQAARFVVCHAQGRKILDFVHCEVLPDPQAQAAIEAAWAEFFVHLDEDTPPPLTERDEQERTDATWRDAVAEWKEAKKWLDAARAAEAAARKALITLAGDRSSVGAGIRLTRYWKSGEIDWRRATEGLDVEPFRKDGHWQFRITEQE